MRKKEREATVKVEVKASDNGKSKYRPIYEETAIVKAEDEREPGYREPGYRVSSETTNVSISGTIEEMLKRAMKTVRTKTGTLNGFWFSAETSTESDDEEE